MAILIAAHEVTKAFSHRPLFKKLTFSISDGERIGLIGPNGAGKSTLLKILSSKDTVDSGTLSFSKGIRIGFLEQVPLFASKDTILSSLVRVANDWDSELKAREWISKLELDQFPEDKLCKTLSGGWKKRVALGRELVKDPDLLLLDEPTNHLDLESILWLEKFLEKTRTATLTVTHDRQFLQNVSKRIIEINPRYPDGLLSIEGGYIAFLEAKENLLSAQERQEVTFKNTLRRETEWLRRGAKARTTKQKARIDRVHELKSVVDDLTVRNRVQKAKLDFGDSGQAPKKLIDAKGLSFKIEDRSLFSNVDLLITPKTRLALLGRNGCGKSTLIRLLTKEQKSQQGEVKHADLLQVAYFEQNRELLDPNLTLMRTLCPTGDFVDYRGRRLHIRSYLDRYLFTPGQMEMKVGQLSGGEQSRVLLAKLMLRPANLLILDEPTNDLDLPTLNILEECLQEFDGGVILVTHDRFFLDQVANQILAFSDDGKLTSFASLEQWEDWITDQQAKAQKEAKAVASSVQTKTKRKLSYNDQRELDTMEETVLKVEAELAELTKLSESDELKANSKKLLEITTQMAQKQLKIDELYMRWSELTS